MIKISRLADYAVVVMATLARNDVTVINASGISAQTHLPEPTVAKVLKMLAKAGLLHSTRGVNGGYQLAQDTHLISVADIVTAVDGPIALTACVEDGEDNCDFEAFCSMKGRWSGVNKAVQDVLAEMTLADMLNETRHHPSSKIIENEKIEERA